MPIAKNTIKLVKEKVKCVQSETLFTKYLKRLTIEIVNQVTVLINWFNRKSGVHPVMSLRQMLFSKQFKTILCKIGKLVMVYNVTSNNKTGCLRAFYALYIRPSNSGTGHIIFKFSIKSVVTTPKCKPNPMTEDIITIIDEIGRKKGIPEEIQFQNMHLKSTFSDLFNDQTGHEDNDSCTD